MTQATGVASSVVLTGITAAIAKVEQRISILTTSPTGGGAWRHCRSRYNAVHDLQLFAQRLHEIQRLLEADPRLLPVIDESIGQQVRAMEQRQSRANTGLAAVTTVIGAILGWLLSAARSPQDILSLLHH